MTTDCKEATAAYERWLGKQLTIIPEDLELKHEHMAEALFPFLRATFYRFMQLWPSHAGPVAQAPEVLAVGDLHVANFGTWRDIESRLVWGINDFDEAAELPYTVDLVRLCVSAHLAISDAHLSIGREDACEAILQGYRAGLECGGKPFVLAEEHGWLRRMMTGELRDPEHFWAKLNATPPLAALPPGSVRKAIARMLPDPKLACVWRHRIAGLGSLGRQRFVATALYEGAQIAREAKALAPSACVWAGKASKAILYQEILDSSVRALDPWVKLKGGSWVVRRLAPDCSRVELSSIPRERDESRLLHAMGFETANVHLGRQRAAKDVLADLKKRARQKHWLHKAAERMGQATEADWANWRRSQPVRQHAAAVSAGKGSSAT